MANNAKNTYAGKDGFLWVGSTQVSALQSFEAKLTANYDEYTECGDGATYQNLTGYSGSGSFTVKKLNSSLNAYVLKALHDELDDDDEVSITGKIERNGKVERVRLTSVTFDEVTLQSFSTGEVMEDEYPFKFSDCEYLDQIAGDFD